MGDPSPATSATEARTPFEVLAERLALPPRWRGRMGYVALLTAFSIAASLLITPGLKSQQVPLLGPEDVGRPFRASSASGFKASHDYEIIHAARTKEDRRAARAAVRPVYDFNASVAGDVLKATRAAFAQMQEIATRHRAAPRAEAPSMGRARKPAAT